MAAVLHSRKTSIIYIRLALASKEGDSLADIETTYNGYRVRLKDIDYD